MGSLVWVRDPVVAFPMHPRPVKRPRGPISSCRSSPGNSCPGPFIPVSAHQSVRNTGTGHGLMPGHLPLSTKKKGGSFQGEVSRAGFCVVTVFQAGKEQLLWKQKTDWKPL